MISDYEIKNEETLMVSKNKMREFSITIKISENLLCTLGVNSNFTILILKKYLEKRGFGDTNDQKLVYFGTLLDNYTTLNDNGIEDGSILTLLRAQKKWSFG